MGGSPVKILMAGGQLSNLRLKSVKKSVIFRTRLILKARLLGKSALHASNASMTDPFQIGNAKGLVSPATLDSNRKPNSAAIR